MPFDIEREHRFPPAAAFNTVSTVLWNTTDVSYNTPPLDLRNEESTRAVFPDIMASCIDEVRRVIFEIRVAKWIDDTKWFSSLSSITKHPEFIEIVELGMPAAKLILERMASGDVHIHWFPALKDITGIDPVPPHERGKLPAMTRAWIEWGKRSRLIH